MLETAVIRYYRDCYEADNRRMAIWNIFHKNIKHRLFIDSEEELLTGFLGFTPVDRGEGIEAKKAAYLYRKEKALVYCSVFAVGHLKNREQIPQPICAPLLLHPAEIFENNSAVFLRINPAERELNHRMLDSLQDEQSSLAERVAEMLGGELITPDQMSALAALLEEAVPGIDIAELYRYPRLVSEERLRAALKEQRETPNTRVRLFPCSTVVLADRSVETRGVFNELSEIADKASLSTPLLTLLQPERAKAFLVRSAPVGRVPAVLSRSQTRVIESARNNDLTLVNGPPGTGKSFTIAALALEHLNRGESVLVASKMDHAVNVIGNKLQSQFGAYGCVVRGGRGEYLKLLKSYLQELLSGAKTTELVNDDEFNRLKRELRRLDRSVESLEQRIEQYSAREINWSRILESHDKNWFDRLRAGYVEWRARNAPALWDLLGQLDSALDERIDKTIRFTGLLHRVRLEKSLRRHRTEFSRFLAAIRARTGGKQEELFNETDFRILLGAFPVWLVKMSDIHDVLPLRPELFDLAIIDEATQCDAASCLPILQRARRAVIVGDPHQLRHLSFLSKERQAALAGNAGLPDDAVELYDYRSKSILDLVSETIPRQDQVAFLDEHYRSVPSIIAFSNAKFYGGSLRIMTARPDTEVVPALVLKCGPGERSASGENAQEARRVVEDVAALVSLENAFDERFRHSIGILSPFRTQIDHISEELSAALSYDAFQRHEILLGTAHTFQGEERDLMFVSLAVGPASHRAAMRFLSRPDVFNVSITRARHKQYIYTSVEPEHLDPASLLGEYLRQVGKPEPLSASESTLSESAGFACEVLAELRRRGFRVWSGYPLAGLVIDIVAARQSRSCAIDLIGHPGAWESPFPVERYKIFRRTGLRIIPLSFTKWLFNKEQCIAAIESALDGAILSESRR